MEKTHNFLIFCGEICIALSVFGGISELALWITKGWLGLFKPAQQADVRAAAIGDLDTTAKAIAEFVKALAAAPVWLALYGAGMLMLFLPK